MENQIQTKLPTELAVIADKVAPQKREQVATILATIFDGTAKMREKLDAVVVTDEKDAVAMKMAREIRLAVRSQRLEAEKQFDALREAVKAEMASFQTEDQLWLRSKQMMQALTKEIETLAQYKEDTAKRAEAAREEALRLEKEAAYQRELAEKARVEEEARKKAEEEARIERERIEAENARLRAEKAAADAEAARIAKERAEEQARAAAEIAKAKADAEAKEAAIKAAADAEAAKLAKELAAERAKAEAIRVEQERIAKEAAAKEAAEKAAAEKARKAMELAPVKEKMKLWVDGFEIASSPVENDKAANIVAKFEAFKAWAIAQIEAME